jgi:hypothetical protein
MQMFLKRNTRLQSNVAPTIRRKNLVRGDTSGVGLCSTGQEDYDVINRKHCFYSISLVICLAGVNAATAQDVLSGEGSPMRIPSVGNVWLNNDSSLVRQWTIVNDDQFPARFSSERFIGVTVFYVDHSFEYHTNFRMIFDVPVVAFRVVFVTFDIWNERVKNLSFSEVSDIDAGTHVFRGRWRLLSENEASEHYSTLAYVDQVRLMDGQVLHADRDAVVEQARRISAGFSEDDLLIDD